MAEKAMTWKEFKDYVDKLLFDNGLTEYVEVDYIDISYCSVDDLNIFFYGETIDKISIGIL